VISRIPASREYWDGVSDGLVETPDRVEARRLDFSEIAKIGRSDSKEVDILIYEFYRIVSNNQAFANSLE